MTDPTTPMRDAIGHAKRERYLGDAVYAEWDGFQVRLRTADGNDQVIYLDDTVMRNLKRLFDDIDQAWKLVHVFAEKEEEDEGSD